MKSRRAHFWGAFWYYPFEQMTAFKVMEMISSSTKDYPHLHNQKFKAAALQNYHDGIFARIGTAAEQSIPVSCITAYYFNGWTEVYINNLATW